MPEQLKVWASPVPTHCDTCKTPIKTKFYDAITMHGPWAFMCPSCQEFGPGRGKLGAGYGQEYSLKAGQWHKTGG